MPDRFASEILAFGRRRNRAVLCIDHTEPQGVDKSQSNRHCSTAVSVVGGDPGTAVSGGAAPIRSGSCSPTEPDRPRGLGSGNREADWFRDGVSLSGWSTRYAPFGSSGASMRVRWVKSSGHVIHVRGEGEQGQGGPNCCMQQTVLYSTRGVEHVRAAIDL